MTVDGNLRAYHMTRDALSAKNREVVRIGYLEHPHPPGKMQWIWSLQIAESSGLPSGWYAEPQSWPVKKPVSLRWQVKAKSELRVSRK